MLLYATHLCRCMLHTSAVYATHLCRCMLQHTSAGVCCIPLQVYATCPCMPHTSAGVGMDRLKAELLRMRNELELAHRKVRGLVVVAHRRVGVDGIEMVS